MEFLRVGDNRRASLVLRSQLYFLLVELPGTREEEQFRSDDQEQDDIDSTREVEHRGSEKRSRRRYMMVSEQ